MNNYERRNLILNTKGHIFRIKFIKANKEERVMVCRLGVKQNLQGVGRTWEKENIITVYDMVKHNYRNINLDTMTEFKCGKIFVEID